MNKESIFCWWKSRSLKPRMFYFFNPAKQWGRNSRFCWWTYLSTLNEPTILLKETSTLFLLLQLGSIFSVPLTNSQLIIWGGGFQLLFFDFSPLTIFLNDPISQISTTNQLAVSYWRIFPESLKGWAGDIWDPAQVPQIEVLESHSFTWSNIRVFFLGIAPTKRFVNGTRYKLLEFRAKSTNTSIFPQKYGLCIWNNMINKNRWLLVFQIWIFRYLPGN